MASDQVVMMHMEGAAQHSDHVEEGGILWRRTLDFVKTDYKPLHPEIFIFSEKFLDPTFLQAVHLAKENNNKPPEQRIPRQEILGALLEPECKRVYSLPIFTLEFCRLLCEEIENFENSRLRELRPNSMNRYGVIMDEMGMGPFFDTFIFEYFQPLAKLLHSGGELIDDHHTFAVEYEMGKDEHLDFHTDDSELTINLCLGKDFKGGAIYFRGIRDDPRTYDEYDEYDHVIGRAILHDGQHRHGALPIEEGQRFNLIIWLRSSEYRRRKKQQQQEEEQQRQQQQQQEECSRHEGIEYGSRDDDDDDNNNNNNEQHHHHQQQQYQH